jgi:hypothetical protein
MHRDARLRQSDRIAGGVLKLDGPRTALRGCCMIPRCASSLVLHDGSLELEQPNNLDANHTLK